MKELPSDSGYSQGEKSASEKAITSSEDGVLNSRPSETAVKNSKPGEFRENQRAGICVLAYGGPEGPDQVPHFLDSILAGRPIPAARREMIENRYYQRGGLSPLNEQCRQFIALLANRLSEKFPKAPPKIYWGNLHSDPPIAPMIEQIAADEITDLTVFAAAPFDGRNGTGKYFARFREALKQVEIPRLRCRFINSFDENRHYLRAASDSLLLTLAQVDLDTFASTSRIADPNAGRFEASRIADPNAGRFEASRTADPNAGRFLIFSAHSIPEKEAVASDYSGKIRRFCQTILEMTKTRIPWTIAFQSRSGSPAIPWTGPALEEVIRQQKERESDLSELIVVPVGFFFENMETVYDLDIETAELCQKLNLNFYRAECPGATDRAAQMLVDLMSEN